MHKINLTFYSWWFENNEKHRLTLTYNLENSVLKVIIDNEPQEHIIDDVQSAKGKSVDCWDLYVGAELDIFGKPTVLKQCDRMTAQWNLFHGRKLLKMRKKLTETLIKYEVKNYVPQLHKEIGETTTGNIPLREVINIIEQLKGRLA